LKKYDVYVDDNFHPGDIDERYHLGTFDTREEALAACRRKVDEYFEQIDKGLYSFKELWEGYMIFGEDPFIYNDDKNKHFSGWDYAKTRCREYAV